VDNIPNTTIKDKSAHEVGLFASKEIPKGSVLCVLGGSVVPANHFKHVLESPKDKNFSVLEWNSAGPDLYQVRTHKTKFGLIMQSECPNVELKGNPATLYALKDIHIDEELLVKASG
jgi:hypothetical protein